MRKNILLKTFIVGLAFSIFSCGNIVSKKTELIYENGNQKVEIQILNGKDYLEYEKPTTTNFVLTNIARKNFIVIGPGIRVIGGTEGVMNTSICVYKDKLETDTLKVKVVFGKGSKENHEFYIPMKREE